MIPLPLAERFGPLLEGWAASSATILAQWLGINASNVGSQVFLPNSVFTVGIACGGLRSAVAIITLATLVAYIVRGPAWARISIVLAAIPAALAANTLRIVLLFVIAAGWNPQTAMDYFHDWSSLVLFLCAFILLLGLTRLLRCSDIRWNVIAPS
jgi:exosortase